MFTSTNKIKLCCQIWFSDSQAEDIPKFTECTEFAFSHIYFLIKTFYAV
jgi:hypothetical protein